MVHGSMFLQIFRNWFRCNADSTVHVESEGLASDVRQHLRNTGEPTNESTNRNDSTHHNSANGASTAQEVRTFSDARCPVCLDEAKFKVQTNCGHIFCGSWVLNYIFWLNSDSIFNYNWLLIVIIIKLDRLRYVTIIME